jgi:hypothetical protein
MNIQRFGKSVSENGGATLDVSSRIQKAREAFAKFQTVWQAVHSYE